MARSSKEISIIVSPPFWKTWWFYTLLLLLIMGSVIGIVRTRVNRVRKNEREQLRLIVATQEKEKRIFPPACTMISAFACRL